MKQYLKSGIIIHSMALLWTTQSFCAPHAVEDPHRKPKNTEVSMTDQARTKMEAIMTDQANNKEVVRRLFEDILNTGHLDQLKEVIGDNFAGRNGEKGPAAFAATIGPLLTGFPDIHYTIEDIVAEGDKVVTRWFWTGTNTGSFAGHPATGNKMRNEGMAFFQLTNGKIVNTWTETDRLGFLQQLGLLPKDIGAPPTPPKQ